MQIDLEPRDYRAKPTKEEPVFVPGALRKVAINAIVLAGIVAVSLPIYWLTKWAISPLEPIVRGFIRSMLNG